MLLSNYLSKNLQQLLKVFTFKYIIILYCALPIKGFGQEKIGFKSFSNIAAYGSLVTKFKNQVIFSFNGNVALNSNKQHNLNVVFNNSFDTVQTNLFNLTANPSGSFFGITPFQNYSNKLFYWGVGDSYDSSNRLTYIFGNANQSDYALINHKAYRSKYYHRPNYTNTFLNDTTFISTHCFKWYHPSSLPYGASIWWFNQNMDTLQQRVYFELNGTSSLLPTTVYPLTNKDILISGFTDTAYATNFDAFIMRLDSAGNVKYARRIGTSGHENMYLTKIENNYYMIGTTIPSYSNSASSSVYLSEIDVASGNVGKTYKTFHVGTGIVLVQDPSVQKDKIYLPCTLGAADPLNLKSCYFVIDTNGIISKQYIHAQASNGYLNSYTMPIVTDSLKNVYGSIMSYNSNSDPKYTKLFKLDSNLVACYPSDTTFSFTTTIANGTLHSLPMNIVIARDSIFEVTNAGAIQQGHGFNTMVDECSDYVGVQENSIENFYFKLYPNPTLNHLVFETEEEISYVKVYNQLGSEVSFKPLSKKSIDVQYLPSGVYYIELKTDSGLLRQKFIKE